MVKKRVPKDCVLNNVPTPGDEKAKMKRLMNDLKSAVVNDLTLDYIKQMLTETMKYRERLMQKNIVDVKQTFSVFYAHPELVHIFIYLFIIDCIEILI